MARVEERQEAGPDCSGALSWGEKCEMYPEDQW